MGVLFLLGGAMRLWLLIALIVSPVTAQAHSEPPGLTDRGGYAKIVPSHGGHAKLVPVPLRHLDAWKCIHPKEGAWNATGYYHGGLQMDWGFMRAYGRDMLAKYNGRGAEVWTPREQMMVAERAVKVRGFTPWPQTARECGYL